MSDRLGIGGNRPPLVTNEQLAIDYVDLENRLTELEAEAESQPEYVPDGDNETQGRVQDFIKTLDKELKSIEAIRVAAKEPFLDAERKVDGYFKQGLMARLISARNKVAKVATDFLRRKEAAERRRREEEARVAREEQQRQARLAQEAREREDRLREQNRQASADKAAAVAREAEAAAQEAEEQQYVTQQAAQAKPAELARTRSADGGSLGTLRTVWNFVIEDVDEIQPRLLWPYIKREHKEAAIRAFIKANAPKEDADDRGWQPIAGVRMFREKDGTFR